MFIFDLTKEGFETEQELQELVKWYPARSGLLFTGENKKKIRDTFPVRSIFYTDGQKKPFYATGNDILTWQSIYGRFYILDKGDVEKFDTMNH